MVSQYLRDKWKAAAIIQMESKSFRPTKQVITWVERHITLQLRDITDIEIFDVENQSKVKEIVYKIRGDKSKRVGEYFYEVLPTLFETHFQIISAAQKRQKEQQPTITV